MEKKLWFKAKRYGYGWIPITWEGWTVIVLYATLLGWIITGIEHTKGGVTYFVIKVFALTLVLIFVGYKKGERARWRWGGEDK